MRGRGVAVVVDWVAADAGRAEGKQAEWNSQAVLLPARD